MKAYLLSLGAGLLVGVIYSLVRVRSPAPPLVALVGLLGILAGEQILPLAKSFWKEGSIKTAWDQSNCGSHLFGMLPGGPRQPSSPRNET
jgi:XapX domain-containing protein